MDANKHEVIHKELSYDIVGIAMDVHNALGCGFLEKVYENALFMKLKKSGYRVEQQAPIKVYFEKEVVGEYFADLLVEDKIILELKCAESIGDVHKAQILNYLKATGLRLGILLNFSKPKLEYVRVVI